MKDVVNYKGEWFIPDDKENKTSGILTVSSNGESKLELMGKLTKKKDPFRNESIDLILGFTTEGKKITLYRSYHIGSTISFPGAEMVKYTSVLILVGDHFYREEELVFDKISSGFKNLEEWASRSGIKPMEHEAKSHEYTFNCELPTNISFKISNGVDGKICFFLRTNRTAYATNFEQKARLSIECNRCKPLTELLDDLILFQNFLTLGVFAPTETLDVVVQNANKKDLVVDQEDVISVKVYYKQELEYSMIKSKLRRQLLFNYQDVEKKFASIIQKWYALNNKLEPIIYLLINNFYKSRFAFSENEFLNIVQALETFHRRFRKNEILPKSEHREKVKTIIDSVAVDYKKWLQERLCFSNEPSLFERLTDLFNESSCETINKIIKDKDQFLKDTKNSRNYYTHYDESIKRKALASNELFLLTEKLKVILITIILIEVGLSKKLVSELLLRNEFNFFNHLLRDS